MFASWVKNFSSFFYKWELYFPLQNSDFTLKSFVVYLCSSETLMSYKKRDLKVYYIKNSFSKYMPMIGIKTVVNVTNITYNSLWIKHVFYLQICIILKMSFNFYSTRSKSCGWTRSFCARPLLQDWQHYRTNMSCYDLQRADDYTSSDLEQRWEESDR